ncbi:MAG: glutathione-dependent reductase, partial [Pseudomonadota bacterium]
LVRFDSVYHGHFKCSRNRLSDYPALWGYARDLMTWPGLADTVDDRAIREAYYGEDTDLNPYGIVAIAPRIDWTATDARKQLGAACVARRCGERIPAVALREHGEDV